MNKIKSSKAIRVILHVLLMAIGFLFLNQCQNFIQFHSEYNGVEHFTKTREFEERYSKYVERVAAYTKYRQDGYTNRHLFSDDSLVPWDEQIFDISPTDNEQNTFEFYNRKLNQQDTNFLYYVKNIITGKEYYSPYFKENTSTEEEVQNKINTFINKISDNSGYFILNTSNLLYSTNVNNFGYITSNTLDWMIGRMCNRTTYAEPSEELYGQGISAEDSTLTAKGTDEDNTSSDIANVEIAERKNYENNILENTTSDNKLLQSTILDTPASLTNTTNEYIVYTGILDDFSRTEDDFYPLYNKYTSVKQEYKLSLLLLPVYMVMLFVLAFFVTSIAGHSRKATYANQIKLSWFDRIYTEIYLLLSSLFIFTSLVFGLRFLRTTVSNFLSIRDYIFNQQVSLFVVYVIVYPVTMFCYLSLVRRIKSGTLITNLLCYRFIYFVKREVRRFLDNRNITYRLLFYFILFVLSKAAISIFLLTGLRLKLPIYYFLSAIVYVCFGYFFFRVVADLNKIEQGTKQIGEGNFAHQIDEKDLTPSLRNLASNVNQIKEGISVAVEERLKSERFKTELITNVSHDIKTPLTSIINYVDLLKKIELGNPTAKGYLDILENKSWRLKTLIEDLVEASKASSGAITLHPEKINLAELLRQSAGEFEDRFQSKSLEPVITILEEPVYIHADGRCTFRIMENVLSNVYKYAMPGTRIYIELSQMKEKGLARLSVKNVSANKLGINTDELMERFTRGDSSRATEGSGLGLSISKSLCTLQKGDFQIEVDGDLFKAIIILPLED